MKWLCLAGIFLVSGAVADEWRSSWDGALYGYAATTGLRTDSQFNPANQIARLPRNSGTLEARFNLKAENDTVRLTARPILLTSHNTYNNQNDSYLSLWQLRLRAAEDWRIAAGREVLNWGPAQFRSPSSPYYFDNGRNNPMRELSGVDALKLSWNPNMNSTITLAHLTSSGHVLQDNLRHSWLLKIDQRGGDRAGGLALSQAPGQGLFAGLHGQQTVSDALMLYLEAATATRRNALQSPTDLTQPFNIVNQSPRQTTSLLGAAYTFESGQTLNAEYLHDGHGYHRDEQSAYYSRAATSLFNAGMALSFAPPLLGRDYLHLVWQSNLMESDGYWRLMATHSFTDGGNELSAYTEASLNPYLSLFALAAIPAGNARQEFSSLFRYNLNAGLKFALP